MTTGATTLPTTNQQPPMPPPPRSTKPTRPPASRTSASPPSPTRTPSLLTSPSDFILATTNASAAGLQTTRFMIQSILDAFEKASNINRTNTTCICLEVLSYSDRRLSAAFSTALPADAFDDARAWASAALLYQYDCWFSLKYVNGIATVSDAMAFTSLPSPSLLDTSPDLSFSLPFCSDLLG